VDGTSIDEAVDASGAAGGGDVAYAPHVHPFEYPGHARHDGDDSSEVKDEVCPRKGGFEACRVGDVAVDALYVKTNEWPAIVVGQDKGTHNLTVREQLADEHVAQMAGGTSDNDHFLTSFRRYCRGERVVRQR
jgi:hypothetical protein